MNIGPYNRGARCDECHSKGPGLREITFRYSADTLILCPGCAPTLQHVLKNEFSRPHLKVQRGRE